MTLNDLEWPFFVKFLILSDLLDCQLFDMSLDRMFFGDDCRVMSWVSAFCWHIVYCFKLLFIVEIVTFPGDQTMIIEFSCKHSDFYFRKNCYYLRHRLASEVIVTLGVMLSRCVCVCVPAALIWAAKVMRYIQCSSSICAFDFSRCYIFCAFPCYTL